MPTKSSTGISTMKLNDFDLEGIRFMESLMLMPGRYMLYVTIGGFFFLIHTIREREVA